jgi:RHS repeat-associated protein
LVPNRHGSSTSYRYGFNGKEKDDEVKGEGNSYDFGARIYDSRIGRWLSPDPKFSLQPNWSPYKAFFDNPNLYIDPDGKTEWQVTTVVNHKTGKTTMIIEVIDADKMDRKVINVRDYYTKDWDYKYSDIIHSSTINIYKDGTSSVENNETQYAERYTRSKNWDFVPEIPSINLGGDSDIKIEDGYVFTTEWGKDGIAGQNKASNGKARSAKDFDVSALEAVTAIIRDMELPKGLDAVNDALNNTSDIVQSIFDKNGIAGEINLKAGKIELKFIPEEKVKVTFPVVNKNIIYEVPNNAPFYGGKDKDSSVYKHDADKVVGDKKAEFFQKRNNVKR